MQQTAYVLAYVGVLSVLVQGVAIGPLARRLSERTLIIAGLPILGASLLAWAFVPNVALTSSLTKAVARDDAGGTLGLAASLQALTGIAAPAIGGLLLQQVGGWSLGALGALILAGLAARTIRTAAPAVDRGG